MGTGSSSPRECIEKDTRGEEKCVRVRHAPPHLHLQDRFESGPTWRVHELRAERGVFCCCNAAEKGEFVLWEKVDYG